MSEQRADALTGEASPAVTGAPQRSVTISDLVRVPLRRWPLVAVCAILGGVVGLGFSQLSGTTYTGSATVVVRPVVTDPFTYPSPGADRSVNMNVETGIANGTEVAAAVAAATGGATENIASSLAVEVPAGSQVLRFNFTAGSAAKAQAGANAAAQGYLKVREQMFREQKQRLLDSYDQSIDTQSKLRDEITKRLPGTAPYTPKVTGALDDIRALNDQLNSLGQQRARIASVDVAPGSLTKAAAPNLPSNGGNILIVLIIGLVSGAFVGVLVSHVREAGDRRIRTERDAEALTMLPMLGAVRRTKSGRTGSALVESEYLALAVAAQLDRLTSRRIAVISARSGEGRTRVAADLAVMLAKQGYSVHLQDTAGDQDELRTRVRAASHSQVPGQPLSIGQETALKLAPSMVTVGGGSSAGNPRDDMSDTMVLPMSRIVPTDDMPMSGENGAAPTFTGVVRFGEGSVRIGGTESADPKTIIVVNPPASESNADGVRAASGAAALLVIANDRSRTVEVKRLVERLRVTGGTPLGFVFVSHHG
jgi:capsular polysaccharide biosynthesis protein